MQIEQMVGAVDDRPELASARKFGAAARAVQHFARPQTVKVLVHTARLERIGMVEAKICSDICEDQRQRASRGADLFAKKPIDGDRAADLVAVSQCLNEDMRPGADVGERPYIRCTF